jgi:hypothetical protein
MLRRVVWWKLTDVEEVLIASIIRAMMMEAVGISETSVNFYESTWRNIPEDSHIHIRHRENLKSHSRCSTFMAYSTRCLYGISDE